MNISDIAKKAQVSTATVSRVINNSSSVRPKTREHVLRVIEECGYTPSAVAKNLSVQTTHSVGVIFPDIENPFFSSALIGVTQVAEQNCYVVSYFNSDETAKKEQRFLRVVREQRLDGVIVSPADQYSKRTRQTLEQFERSGVAVVLLDRDLDGGRFSLVNTEDRDGAYRAVKQLIQVGHRRIAIVRGSPSNSPVFNRYAGYLEAISEAGLPLREEYIRPADQKSELAYRVTGELLNLKEPPTAIFTCNNMMTLGCLRYLTEHGLVPGRDVALIGFDDIETLRVIGYPLSVVDRSSKEMGKAAMELLIQRLEHPNTEKKVVTIPTQMILRGSERIKHP